MKKIHLGNGVIVFENAFGAMSEEINIFLDKMVKNIRPDSYAPISDEQQSNSGGYEFSNTQIIQSPSRYQNLQQNNDDVQYKNFIYQMDNCLIKCAVEYCKIFPAAIETIKWKTNGYVIRYQKGQYIGPHSDCALPYDSSGNAISQFPLYNTLTSALVLSDANTGGEIQFRPWGITVKPIPGSVIMYSSSYMGCHEVSPIEDGERFAYLSWFGHGNAENERNYISMTDNLNQIPQTDRYPKLVMVGEIK